MKKLQYNSPVILTFFLLSAPIENTEVAQGNYASLFPNDMLREVSLRSVAITPIQTGQDNVAKLAKEPRKEVTKEVTPVKKTVAKDEKKAPAVVAHEVKVVAKKYHILVASMSTEREARQMVETLRKKGFEGASAIIGGGKKRVSIESCATYAEAQQKLGEIRKSETYKSAWVLKH